MKKKTATTAALKVNALHEPMQKTAMTSANFSSLVNDSKVYSSELQERFWK